MARRDNDYYPTPQWAAKRLMQKLLIGSGDVLCEPCIGEERAIIKQFPVRNEVKWAELTMGRDYLNTDLDLSADVIITNPPFSLLMEFLEASLFRDLHQGGTCCYLLRLSALGSKKRHDFWKFHPPTHLLPLSDRPKFVNNRSDNSEYAWFVWDYGNRLEGPRIQPIKE